MEVVSIQGNNYTYLKRYQQTKALRDSFNHLSEETFGLNFEKWYREGYWQGCYIPYSLIHEGHVIANVSVNLIDFMVKGKLKKAVQLGTVMTHPGYQGRGLSRFLMERVLEDWKDKSDMVYLFANDRVVDFYPKFGFLKAVEYEYTRWIKARNTGLIIKRLDMQKEEDRLLLLEKYREKNPFSALDMTHNEGLLMFYCTSFMKDMIYYIESYGCLVIAEYKDNRMMLYDVFGQTGYTLKKIIGGIAKDITQIIELGFTPIDTTSYEVKLLEEEGSTLFYLNDKENLIEICKGRFPVLSHA